MTLFRWIFAGAVIVLVGLAAVAGLKPRQPPPQNVKTALARRSAITSTVRAAGKLEPLHKVNVSSNITGTLLDLQVGIGSKVKKGQYLGQIDTSRYRAQVEQQHAQAEASEADVKREEANLARLRNVLARISDTEGKAFNVGEREQAQTQVQVSEAQLASNRSRAQVARAALREATNSLSWATLRAPVDGTVLSVNHRVGERVRGSDFAEDVVLVLGSLQTMDVRIDVGEHDVVHVRTGLKAVITVDALPKLKLHGEVIDSGRDAIIKNPGTDNEVTNFPVWVSMDDPPPDALSGMSAQVTIFTETRPDAVVVPIQAVTVRPREAPADSAQTDRDKFEKVVFVVKSNHVEKRRVETGISSESHIEIASGLTSGEEVVEGPYRVLARDLKDGTHVIAERSPEPSGAASPPAAARADHTRQGRR
ncbi:MAG TPA: efflux RND transporter periplasmic adaptor subunit [Polyangia bacterium]|nr:efflux RND transporter periplasmic adaptor subunit [Polyangia bacterium]